MMIIRDFADTNSFLAGARGTEVLYVCSRRYMQEQTEADEKPKGTGMYVCMFVWAVVQLICGSTQNIWQ